jgi:hypothetical protein
MSNETWLVMRLLFDKADETTNDRMDEVILSFVKRRFEALDGSSIRTWHFFREQEDKEPKRPYLLLRVCGARDYLISAVKPAIEADAKKIVGTKGIVGYHVREEPNYNEEGGFGTEGWPIAQKVFESTAEASLFLLDYRAKNMALPVDFDEGKFVHCFLNQARGSYAREKEFYVKRLKDLGVDIEQVRQLWIKSKS